MDQVIPVLIAVVVIAAVYVSATRNPLRQCPKCKGAGRIPSAILSGRYRPCPKCGRSGEVRGVLGRGDD